MKQIPWCRLGAVLLLSAGLLAAAMPAEARRHHHRHADPATDTASDSGRGDAGGGDAGGAGGGAAGFDYYLLSLSIAPTFCRLSPRNASLEECQALSEDSFERTPLTVHGLWPNRARVGVRGQPHDCGTAELGSLPPQLAADLRRYMPGGPRLEQHEWQTHGTCSGLSPADYFGTAARLAQSMDQAVGNELRSHSAFGTSVRVADLIADVAAHDPGLAAALVVDCRSPRGGGATLISEIRVTLDKSFQPIPASSVGLGQNSGCQGGAGVLPRVGM